MSTSRTARTLLLAAFVLGLVAWLPGARPVQAEIYSRDGYSFDLGKLSLAQVQDSIVSNLTMLSSLGGLFVWKDSPCYRSANAKRADLPAIDKVFALVNAREKLKVERCGGGKQPGIVYYITAGRVDDSDEKALLNLEGNPAKMDDGLSGFLKNDSSCSWDMAVGGLKQRGADRVAVLMINGRLLDDEGEADCLFFGSMAILGLGFPATIPDENGKQLDRKTHVELNLLSLFVLTVVAEDNRGWERAELVAKIRNVLFVMHELGK